MAIHPGIAIQQKIFDTIKDDATIITLVGSSIFDNVPDNSDFPYITIGEVETGDFSSHTNDGFEGSVTVHVWSQDRGRNNTKTIQARIYTLLQNLDLAIVGVPTLNFRLGSQSTILDPDGRTNHGIQTFNILLGGN